MLRKLWFLPIITWLLMSVPSMSARAADDANTVSAGPMRIAVVDFRQIMQQSEDAKKAVEKLKKEFQDRENKIREAEAAIEKKQAKLKRDAAVMPAADQKKLEADILADQREVRRMEEDYQQDLTAAQDQALQQLLVEINKAIAKVAQKGQYDIVLEKNRVPYVSSKLDVTEQIIKELN